jgi:glycerol-3-phosphate dehydrogenase (NAD(P)+)
VKLCLLGAGELASAIVALVGTSRARFVTQLADAKPAPDVAMADSLEDALDGADLIVLCGNGEALAELSRRYGPHARGDHHVLVAARGVRAGFELPDRTVRGHTCVRKLGVLGGPLHTQELYGDRHATVMLATHFREVIERVRAAVPGERVTIEPTTDMVGLGVAGAYGHVSSILTGLGEELGFSKTARGLLIAHGMMEARALGLALGGQAETFLSIAGWGELIPRSQTRSDRHEQLGRRLARQAGSEAPDADLEGIETVHSAVKAGQELGVPTPVAAVLRDLLHRTPNGDPAERLQHLLHRPLQDPSG